MPNTAGKVMGIIGGILSIIMGYFMQIAAHPIVQASIKLLIMAGGVIAIIGGAKAGFNPKQARILMIVGGILSLGNLMSIIGGVLTREEDEYAEISDSFEEEEQIIEYKKVLWYGLIILFIGISSIFIATQTLSRFSLQYIRILGMVRPENLLLILVGILIMIGGGQNKKVPVIIGSIFGIAACTIHILRSIFSLLDIGQKIFWIENIIYLCLGIFSLILIILSLNYIRKNNVGSVN